MASFLDIGMFEYFNVIFSFLLILILVYAILQKTKIVGSSNAINALIAVVIAFLSILSEPVIGIINFVAPWFVVMFIFLILLLLLFQILGATDADIAVAVKDKAVIWTILGIGIIIIVAGFANVFGQELLEGSQSAGTALDGGTTSGNNFEDNVLSTIFHPRILGMMVLFGIAIFAIALLTGD